MLIGDIYLGDDAPRFKASDIETDNYKGSLILQSPLGTSAVLMRSKSCVPVRWCVAYGAVNLFFLSYRSAIDYCKKHGFKNERGKAL